jgi:hypothetical protein
MNTRLSLEERGNLAFKLRATILTTENPAILEAINDPIAQPHDLAIGIYAFEFFLDKFRPRFDGRGAEVTAYNVGWTKASLLKDEETISRERIARMSAHLFMVSSLETGDIDAAAKQWKAEAFKSDPISEQQLSLLLHEVFYELAYEAAYKRFDKDRT